MFGLNKIKTFYWGAGSITVAGWLWIIYNYNTMQNSFTTCIFKNITGIPCPACGSTRSVLSISHGHLKDAMLLNPFGYILSFALISMPIWLLIDIINGNNTLHNTLVSFDKHIKKRPIILIVIVLLVIMNWVWNLWKL